MYKVLLCHRRAADVPREAFQEHWRHHRRALVLDLKSDLGFQTYRQTHQVSRWNPVYQGARASRSWVATAPFVALNGHPVAPPWGDGRSAMPGGGWDVVEELAYPSERALVDALSSSAGMEAFRRLADDQESRTRRTVALVVETHVPVPNPEPSFPQVTLLFFLRSRAGTSRNEMLEYWGSSHEELFLSVQDALGYREYEQMHVRSTAAVSAAIERVGTPAPDPFDGVARVAYADLWSLGISFLNPVALFANTRLIRDETTFADLQRSTLLLGREYRFDSSEASPGTMR